jgi:two-component system NtrC family sensor kinase
MQDDHQRGSSHPVTERQRSRWSSERWPRPVLIAICIALILGVGVVDDLTGMEASVTLLYLLPIALGTWMISRTLGLLLAGGCSFVWLVVERIQGAPYANPWVQWWNALALFVLFAVLASVLAALRESHARLEDKVQQRTAELASEIAVRREAEKRLAQTNVELLQNRENLLQTVADLKRSHAELKDTQLQLIQAAKMESVGRLAAGVAHEVKNPLMTILLGIDYLERLPQAREEKVGNVLKDQRDAVERAGTVINELLDFSAPSAIETQPQDLNVILERALGLVKHEFAKRRVSVVRNLQRNLPIFSLDRRKMEQVFVNALINAAHAMPTGGTVTVRTYATPNSAAANVASPQKRRSAEDGLVITAEIDDTGTGVPEDHLAKVFDPFFTTKPPGEGTGLGLSVVREIVRMHGGTVDLSNRSEGGARFTLRFFQKGAGTTC